jgi:UDP-N-acetyl-D-glucosamine dehydrogenase
MRTSERTIQRLLDKSAVIGVLGLGYAGLPLACTFAEAGFTTLGFDVDTAKIDKLRRGESYIGHISPERISKLVSGLKLQPQPGFDALINCDAAIICVPTPLDENRTPDLTFVIDTAKAVRPYLHEGLLVVLESTTYPGTTEEVLLPIFADSGLKVGKDVFLAFSPEREDPANENFTTRTIPKIVGGVTPDCLAVAATAYGQVVEKVVPVSSARVAESTKLLENIYRCVNIAMVNELKVLFEHMQIDVWEVIKAAGTKPFGFTPFYPGPGLGGHCIPIDPFYLTWKARQFDFATRFIELAGEVNSAMPEHVVGRLAQGLNLAGKPLKDANILLLGVAYKRDIEDVRESPSLRIIELLHQRLARVSYYDPHVPKLISRHLDRDMSSINLTEQAVRAADAVVIVTDHKAVDYAMVVRNARLIVDTRNATGGCRDGATNIITA